MHRPSIYDRLSQRREQQERLERERLEQEALKAVPPPRFFTNELSFVRPEALKDKTYQLLTLTDIGPSPFSLVIGRSQVSPDVDLEVLSQQLLKELEKSLAHLQWLEPLSAAEVAGVEARRAELRWRQHGQPVHQIQLIFLHRDEHGCPLLIQITASSNNPKGMTAIERSAFEEMLGSLALRATEVEKAAAV
ncbi:DcrB-related protein [Pseudomonas sp. R9(2017)]|uniref:DcrB-related protein n=3 Tax=Pseudomonas TaxID=286 RepID=UPI000A1E9E8D|nr:DcrB-related protein [Pseudomonas sp. R9(2017)]